MQTKIAVTLVEMPLSFQGVNRNTLNQAWGPSMTAPEASPDQRTVSLHTLKQAKSFSFVLE